MGPLILTLANLTDVVLDKNINLVNEFMALKIHFFVNENEIKLSMDIFLCLSVWIVMCKIYSAGAHFNRILCATYCQFPLAKKYKHMPNKYRKLRILNF